MRSLALIASLTVTAACAPPPVQRFPEKPPNCALEVVKTLPQRPYTEIETIELSSLESTREVLDHAQQRACRDGADAIYAPKGGRVYSYAIAVKWNDAPAAAAPAAAAPAAAAPAAAAPAAAASAVPAPPPPASPPAPAVPPPTPADPPPAQTGPPPTLAEPPPAQTAPPSTPANPPPAPAAAPPAESAPPSR